MSVNSPRQTVEAFQEWHKWAKAKMPAFKKASKKKPTQKPIWSLFDEK
jgi:hypothetical protein|tara:strand:- start:34 stop:177 length:144 start_codon:yes stop_codon:yes gene_type:complete|eukprot:SAG31_NODE_4097_length_3590_cov_3.464353_7_plen_48_part_00